MADEHVPTREIVDLDSEGNPRPGPTSYATAKSMSDPLLTWLLAEIAADERVAMAAPGPKWVRGLARDEVPGPYTKDFVALPPPANSVAPTGEILLGGDFDNRATSLALEHVMLHDPERVLRDLDAARRLLHGHEPERCAVGYDDATAEAQYANVCSACRTDESRERWPCRHVRLVALPFSDRRGYRPEWRP